MRALASPGRLKLSWPKTAHRARRRRRESEHQLEQRRLARAVLAEHADDVAGRDARRTGPAAPASRRTTCSGVTLRTDVLFSCLSPTCFCRACTSSASLDLELARRQHELHRGAARSAAGVSRAASARVGWRPRSSACRDCARAALRPPAGCRPSRSSSGSWRARCASSRTEGSSAPGCELAARDHAPHLLEELAVDRDAGMRVEDEHVYQYSNTHVVGFQEPHRDERAVPARPRRCL